MNKTLLTLTSAGLIAFAGTANADKPERMDLGSLRHREKTRGRRRDPGDVMQSKRLLRRFAPRNDGNVARPRGLIKTAPKLF